MSASPAITSDYGSTLKLNNMRPSWRSDVAMGHPKLRVVHLGASRTLDAAWMHRLRPDTRPMGLKLPRGGIDLFDLTSNLAACPTRRMHIDVRHSAAYRRDKLGELPGANSLHSWPDDD